MTLDVDHFKSYNDAFGHAAGDEVLRGLANILRAGTRPGDLVVRTGGEEFAIVLPGVGSNEALVIADRLRMSIAEHPWRSRPVTASFGISVAANSHGTTSIADLLDAADRALYHSKRTGRNRVTHFHFLIDAEAAASSPGNLDMSPQNGAPEEKWCPEQMAASPFHCQPKQFSTLLGGAAPHRTSWR